MAALADTLHLPQHFHISFVIVALLVSVLVLNFIVSTLKSERPWKGIPLIALPEKGLGPKASWIKYGREVVVKGAKTGAPFQVMTGTGPKICLPNSFADDLKSDPKLSLVEAFNKEFFFQYPGFEAFAHNNKEAGFLPDLVRTKLTTSLGLITEDLVDETSTSIHDIFGEDSQWHTVELKQCTLDLVARLSSRVFLGLPLCRNERWLDIAKNYTVDAINASRQLRAIPSLLRPVAQYFLPIINRLKKQVRDATDLIQPEVDMRRARAQKALAQGTKPPKTADTIGWMYEMTQGKREELNYIAAQLSLTMAAIHTTSEALSRVMIDICGHPEVIEPLREEIVQVIGTEGWSKTTLYKMRRLDSILKESERFHMQNAVSMNRLVKGNITLSDGSTLPAGSRTMVVNAALDPAIYSKPETFDPWRFFNITDHQSSWQHVAVQYPSQLSFGYGKHACPGRFFASNELKIALAHMLLKYDWRMESVQSLFFENETSSIIRPDCKIELRRREEEMSLELPEKTE